MARRFSAAHINMPSPTSYKLQATSYQGGQAIIAAVIFLVLLSTVILGGLVMPIVRSTKAARGLQYSKTSFYGAESGIEDAVYRLRNNLSFEVRHNFEQRRYESDDNKMVENFVNRSVTLSLIFDLN